MVNDAILIRIQRLLTLASNPGASVNESAAAFAAAQKLLARYNLDLAQVEITTGVKQASENIVNSTEPLYSGQRVILWKSTLAIGLCNLNACQMYIATTFVDGEKEISYQVVGRSSDVALVRYFFNSIVSQIELLSSEALKRNLGRGKTFTNNFKHGASSTVIDRLNKTNQEVRAEYQSTALVLVDNKATEVASWVRLNMKLGYRNVNYTAAGDSRGFNLGRAEGERVALNRGLDNGANGVKMMR